METLALILFLLPLVGGGIYFLARLVQGDVSLLSMPEVQTGGSVNDHLNQPYIYKSDDDLDYCTNPIYSFMAVNIHHDEPFKHHNND